MTKNKKGLEIVRKAFQNYLLETGNLFETISDVELFIKYVEEKANEGEREYIITQNFLNKFFKNIYIPHRPYYENEVEFTINLYWLLRDWYS